MLKKCSSLLLALALITVLFTGCRGNAKNENQTGDPGHQYHLRHHCN